jgi:hypothetical protein
MQTWVPLAQEVAPAWQGFAGAHAALAVHGKHCPPLQTWSTPQAVPFASAVPASMQTWVPLAQEVTPAWHGFAGVHAEFMVQATHCPALQTWSTSQAVPFASAVPVSTQTWDPVAQEVTPERHGFAGVQAALALQATHCPPLQT